MSIFLKLFCVLIVCGVVRMSAARFGNRVAVCLLGFPTMTSLLTAVNLDGLRSAAVQNLAEAGLAGLMAATVLATTLALVALRSRNVLVTWGISLMTYSVVVASAHWTGLLPFWLQAVVAAVLLAICGIVLCRHPVPESELTHQSRSSASYWTFLLPGGLVVAGECVRLVGWPLLLALIATFPTMTCSQLAFSRAAEGTNGPLLLVRRLPFTNLSTLAFWSTLRISVGSMSIENAFVLSLAAAGGTLAVVVCVVNRCSRICQKANHEGTAVSETQEYFEEIIGNRKNVCPVGLPMLASEGVTIQISEQNPHQHVLVN